MILNITCQVILSINKDAEIIKYWLNQNKITWNNVLSIWFNINIQITQDESKDNNNTRIKNDKSKSQL